MNLMSVKKQFSKYANQYNNHNIIQQIAAKSIVRDINNKPKRILELGCGSGQIFKYITWDLDFYKAIDFSPDMCELHPKAKNVKVECHDFDEESFHNSIKDEHYDLIISSSALQWSKDLKKIVKRLSTISAEINVALFTSNTFKTIQDITNQTSPILSQEEIKDAFLQYCECEIEVFNYNLEFDNKKELFDYIKKSGVSGNNKKLSYKDSKLLLQKYDLNYLEFEVIFIKAFSKS